MPFVAAANCVATGAAKKYLGALTVVLALTAYGCGSDRGLSPVAPTPTVILTPLPTNPRADNATGDLWRLSTKIVAIEGAQCFWTHSVGVTVDTWTLSVDRSELQVRFLYDVYNPHDNLLYAGAVNGLSFSAASDTLRSFWQCAGSVSLSSSVEGRFSADGQTLSGRERLKYRTDDGRELVVTLEWNATPM